MNWIKKHAITIIFILTILTDYFTKIISDVELVADNKDLVKLLGVLTYVILVKVKELINNK